MKTLSVVVATFVLTLSIMTPAMAQEWTHFNWADLRPLGITFDKIELFIHNGNQTFVCPAFEDPQDPSGNPMDWEGGLINPNYVRATGTATQAVGWTDHYSGPQGETFTLTLLAWSGDTFVFGGDCNWTGSSYSCPIWWTDPGADPHPDVYDRTEQYSIQDWANLIPLGLTFDVMELFIIAGNQTYVEPGVDDFRDQYNMPNGWGGELCNPTHCLAIGPATQYVRWFDHMSGPRPETYTLTALFWLDGTFVLGQDAFWNGCDGWTNSPWWTDPGNDPHPDVYDRSGCTISTKEATWGQVKALYR
jgi:hypothetical protein